MCDQCIFTNAYTCVFRNAQKRWQDTRTLIVDEVSMLSAPFLDKIEYVARHIRNQPHLPWGGLQLILGMTRSFEEEEFA